MVEGMVSIHVAAQGVAGVNGPVSRSFQEMLRHIPTWSREVRQHEAERVEKAFPDVRRVLQSAVAASARILETRTPEVPSTQEFVHAVYLRLARQAWMTPRLYEVDSLGPQTTAAVGVEIRAAVLELLDWGTGLSETGAGEGLRRANEMEAAPAPELEEADLMPEQEPEPDEKAVRPMWEWRRDVPPMRYVNVDRAAMVPENFPSGVLQPVNDVGVV